MNGMFSDSKCLNSTEKAVLAAKKTYGTETRHMWFRNDRITEKELDNCLAGAEMLSDVCTTREGLLHSEPDAKRLKNYFHDLKALCDILYTSIPSYRRRAESFGEGGRSCGNLIEIMIPRSMTDRTSFDQVLQCVIESYNLIDGRFTAFTFHYHKGRKNGNFLGIYVLSRPYFKDEIDTPVTVHKKDVYRNSITGRMCKKNDKHAIVYKHAGDPKQVVRTHFGASTETNAITSAPADFKKHREDIKEKLNAIYNSLQYDDCAPFLGEYDGNHRNFNILERKAIARYNNMFAEIEEIVCSLFQYLKKVSTTSAWYVDFTLFVRKIRSVQTDVHINGSEWFSSSRGATISFRLPYFMQRNLIGTLKARLLNEIVKFCQYMGIGSEEFSF